MKKIDIHISDYDYPLHEDRIAKYPLQIRDASKLLIYQKGNINQIIFQHIDKYISGDDLIVFNNSKVIQARLLFTKPTGAKIEIFCLEPSNPADYHPALNVKSEVRWKCLIGNAKRWETGQLSRSIYKHDKNVFVKAEKVEKINNIWIIKISWEPGDYLFREILEIAGSTPIPPYLHREPEPVDKNSYQTVYSEIEGSVAAPTAGFHFTPQVLDKLKKKAADTIELTLHIGAGTFRPVLVTDIHDHEMHPEHIYFSKSHIKKILEHHGKILAVGTTSARSLETIYWLGCKVAENMRNSTGELNLLQWEDIYLHAIPKENSLQALISYFENNHIETFHTITQLMIIPGYKYRMVNKMITNFHQPRSSLLLLVSAFIGDDWRKVYRYAMENGFRFLSYGDSSLLIP